VRRLVAEQVDSIGALDLLMLLRQDKGRWWTADSVCEALRCPRRWAVVHLERMHQDGLLTADGDSPRRYAFRPRDAALGAAADDLADAYTTRTGDVVKLIFSLPGPELRDFSVSFWL
jgi:DNA-binding IclR family transcriptional regulator